MLTSTALNDDLQMKQLAIAVLLLFATSLLGDAFASGCAAMTRAPAEQTQVASPSCCDFRAACMGGSCFARVRQAGCTSDHGSVAVAQKSEPAGDLTKAPALTFVAVLSLVTIAHKNVHRSRPRIGDAVRIASYADIFARTGRLLI